MLYSRIRGQYIITISGVARSNRASYKDNHKNKIGTGGEVGIEYLHSRGKFVFGGEISLGGVAGGKVRGSVVGESSTNAEDIK
jgi:hypothetical protein